MSQKTYKNFLEAGSFKALKNVADVARQVMLGEDQEKQEIQGGQGQGEGETRGGRKQATAQGG